MEFSRKKVDRLDGSVGVIYRESESGAGGGTFEIHADRRGVCLVGQSSYMEGPEDLRDFAKVIGDAWKDHLALKTRIVGLHN